MSVAKWPHRRLADLLHEWATATGEEKVRAAAAFDALEKEMAELLVGLFRAYLRHRGEHETFRVLLGEVAFRALMEWQDTMQRRYDKTQKRCEDLERRLARLEQARPQLKVVPG